MTDKDSSPSNVEKTAVSKLTYQPFLLVVVLATLLVKVAVSLSTGGPILDWLFGVILIMFIASLILYAWDRFQQGKNKQTAVSISTEKAVRSGITGIRTDTKQTGTETINIKTGDVEESSIMGVERKQRDQSI